MKQPEINCSYDELRASITLQPHPRNPNTHSDEQIKLLAKIIQHQGWRNPVVVSKLSGFIVAGHGRLKAAELLGLDEVPVDLQDFKTEADELAHLVADNRIAELSEINRVTLADIIADLDTGDIDLELTGFEIPDIEDLMTAAPPEKDSNSEYTNKIKAPSYEITGEKPEVTELVDTSKSLKLKNDIIKHSMPDDVRLFMEQAANRHNVFNYQKIAEFYAHANKELQELMEESALVIIDFDKAIENGYVKMSEKMAELYGKEYPDE